MSTDKLLRGSSGYLDIALMELDGKNFFFFTKSSLQILEYLGKAKIMLIKQVHLNHSL